MINLRFLCVVVVTAIALSSCETTSVEQSQAGMQEANLGESMQHLNDELWFRGSVEEGFERAAEKNHVHLCGRRLRQYFPGG